MLCIQPYFLSYSAKGATAPIQMDWGGYRTDWGGDRVGFPDVRRNSGSLSLPLSKTKNFGRFLAGFKLMWSMRFLVVVVVAEELI